jgi:hypothetical protein
MGSVSVGPSMAIGGRKDKKKNPTMRTINYPLFKLHSLKAADLANISEESKCLYNDFTMQSQLVIVKSQNFLMGGVLLENWSLLLFQCILVVLAFLQICHALNTVIIRLHEQFSSNTQELPSYSWSGLTKDFSYISLLFLIFYASELLINPIFKLRINSLLEKQATVQFDFYQTTVHLATIAMLLI